jgi:hypothetical protein
MSFCVSKENNGLCDSENTVIQEATNRVAQTHSSPKDFLIPKGKFYSLWSRGSLYGTWESTLELWVSTVVHSPGILTTLQWADSDQDATTPCPS